ncbi:MAG TPA: COQ9 family protein [Stellaceae bacterium]|jgi:ubiquinone biosynthesis protein COQ9|nr:COQ9 family protein [Stellaceae bacterium]
MSALLNEGGLAARKDALLLAMLPNVPFDGWTRSGMRAAAARAEIDIAELPLLFPGGTRDVASWFSDWADRQTLAALKRRHIGTMKIRERIAAGVMARLEILLPHREAVRRSLSLFATPLNIPRGAKLLYDTVDAIWHAAGDRSTDFNFYTKRGLLAGVYAATSLYWLDDRSDNMEATREFLDRRLAEVLAIPKLPERVGRLNPLRVLKEARQRFSAAR